MYILAIVIAAVLIALDQFTKRWAALNLKDKPIPIIEGVFELRYLENRGAAFGLLQGKRIFFVIITVLILLIIIFMYIKMPNTKIYNWIRVSLVMIFAGAIGNFIDRLLRGYVVDFLSFKLINFPIFNLADVFVVTGSILFGILLIFFVKDDDLNIVNKKKKSISELTKNRDVYIGGDSMKGKD